MEKTKREQIRKLLSLSKDLEELAEKFAADADNDETLKLFGTVLDTAHKLRVSVQDLWKDTDEQ